MGSFYTVVQEWEPENPVFSQGYCNSIEQYNDEDDAMGRAFRKKYHVCVHIFILTEQRSYLAIDLKWFPRQVGDELAKVYECYIAQLSEDHNHLDNVHHW